MENHGRIAQTINSGSSIFIVSPPRAQLTRPLQVAFLGGNTHADLDLSASTGVCDYPGSKRGPAHPPFCLHRGVQSLVSSFGKDHTSAPLSLRFLPTYSIPSISSAAGTYLHTQCCIYLVTRSRPISPPAHVNMLHINPRFRGK